MYPELKWDSALPGPFSAVVDVNVTNDVMAVIHPPNAGGASYRTRASL